MTERRLAAIYHTIRQLEWRRRDLRSRLQEERERAAGLYSLRTDFLKVKQSRAGAAPQEKSFERIDFYSDALSVIEERERELAKSYFYDVQTLIEYAHAKAIYKYITGLSFRSSRFGDAVKEMSAALNAAARSSIWGSAAHPLFKDDADMRESLSPAVVRRAERIAVRVTLSWAADKSVEKIIRRIRAKCKSRSLTEECAPENAILYAEICALEKEYIYRHTKALTEEELLIVEKYMTNTEKAGEIRENNRAFFNALRKLEAAKQECRD